MAYRKKSNVVILAFEKWHFIFDTETRNCSCFDEPKEISVLNRLVCGSPVFHRDCNDDDDIFLRDLKKEGFLTDDEDE